MTKAQFKVQPNTLGFQPAFAPTLESAKEKAFDILVQYPLVTVSVYRLKRHVGWFPALRLRLRRSETGEPVLVEV